MWSKYFLSYSNYTGDTLRHPVQETAPFKIKQHVSTNVWLKRENFASKWVSSHAVINNGSHRITDLSKMLMPAFILKCHKCYR